MNQSKKRLAFIPAVCLLTTLNLGIGGPGISNCFGQAESQDSRAVKDFGTATDRASSKAETKPLPTQFLRVTKDDSQNPLSMQTAITRYRPAKGELVVDLVGAVHIGEADYYKRLNEQFKNYDVVLYELVAPKGTKIPKGGKKKSTNSPLDLISWMQGQAQSTLGLESQLKLVDYQKDNFTHADMSPTEMSEKMAERGDTPLTVGLSAITEMMRQQNRASQSGGSTDIASQLTNENIFESLGDPLKMKRMMANQFAQSGVMDMGLGQTLNQLLITDRNAAAIKVLQKEIANGKKKIAIFYGAAHMPDFEKHLVNDFGLKKTNQAWIDAWDLTKAGQKPSKTGGTTKLLFKMLDELSR
ncbi:MAG: hypothetical protein AB8B55_16280 [Mariniblastus sp.]